MQTPSLLLHGARVLTMDPRRPCAEAVAVAGERFVAVGDDAQVRPLAGATTATVDCEGRLLVPGFIDAHVHLLATAARARFLDCSAARAPTIDDLVRRIQRWAAEQPGTGWIRAFGYHEAALRERRHPLRWELDRAAGSRPLRLTHASGHASVLNSAALAALGIDRHAEEPPGGTIGRSPDTGEPDGLLLEMEDWLDRVMPPPSAEEMARLVRGLSRALLAAGVTSVQDLGHRNDRRRAAFLAGLVADGSLAPRLTLATGYAAFAAGEDAAAPGLARGPVKIVLNETGDNLLPTEPELRRQVAEVHRAGRQVAIHAVEPRAVAAAVDAIERAQALDGRRGRHRVEHASITPPPIAERVARAGAVAVSNPAFLRHFGDRYLETVPAEDRSHLYDVVGLLRAGVQVAAGSDCPVSPPEPLAGIFAACTRRTASGRQVPGECLGLEDAIRLFTATAAWAAFQERESGRIVPGLLADLVLLDVNELSNGLDGADRDAPVARACMTVLGGKIAWVAPGLDLPARRKRTVVHAR